MATIQGAVSNDRFAIKLCEAFGIDPGRVASIDFRLDASSAKYPVIFNVTLRADVLADDSLLEIELPEDREVNIIKA